MALRKWIYDDATDAASKLLGRHELWSEASQKGKEHSEHASSGGSATKQKCFVQLLPNLQFGYC